MNKSLSTVISHRVGDKTSIGRIRSRGDQALFGGQTTKQMKERLNAPANRPLADFLPTITIKAKDFVNEITNFRNISAVHWNSRNCLCVHVIQKEFIT